MLHLLSIGCACRTARQTCHHHDGRSVGPTWKPRQPPADVCVGGRARPEAL